MLPTQYEMGVRWLLHNQSVPKSTKPRMVVGKYVHFGKAPTHANKRPEGTPSRVPTPRSHDGAGLCSKLVKLKRLPRTYSSRMETACVAFTGSIMHIPRLSLFSVSSFSFPSILRFRAKFTLTQ